VSERLAEARGTRLALREAGSGPPLLFLDGPLGATWSSAHDRLAERFRVLAPDAPGTGGSESCDWLAGADDLAFLYLDLLDALGLERVRLVGVSVGGWVAAEMAVFGAARVERLVLTDAAGLRVAGGPVADPFAVPPAGLGRLLFHDPALVGEWESRPETPESLERSYRERAALARLAWSPFFHDPKLARRLHRVTASTLVLWGAEDRLIPAAHGEAYAELIPGARLELVPECGHLPHVERPEMFARIVLESLEG
jgi:pimeloyl-ACP methyl ester carboxylesterase